MPTTYKVLGQVKPNADSLTTAYTVPSSTQTVVSTITVCNYGVASSSYRIAVRPAGAAIEDKHYVAYDASVAPQDTITLTLGITLAATDVVSVQAGTAYVSFNLFGSEIS